MKKLISLFALVLALLCSCCTAKPVATTSHERIEERLRPVAIAADTIELEYKYRPLPLSGTSPNLGEELDRRTAPKVGTRHAVSDTSEASIIHSSFLTPHSSLKTTRPLTLQTIRTDSSMRIKLTLRPDTIYVPYTTHIRSDTIVAPDPTTVAKLTSARWKMALLIVLMLIIIVVKIRTNGL